MYGLTFSLNHTTLFCYLPFFSIIYHSFNMKHLTILSSLLAIASASSYTRRSGEGKSPDKAAGPSNLARDAATLTTFAKTVHSDPKGIVKTWVGTKPCKFKGIICAERPDGVLAVAGVDLNGVSILKDVRKEDHTYIIPQANLGSSLKLTNLVDKLTDITTFHANTNGFTGEVPDVSALKYLFEIGQQDNPSKPTN